MAPSLLSFRDSAATDALGEPTHEPVGGRIFSVVLALTSLSILAVFLAQRILSVRAWRQLPPVVWLVFIIYSDSFLFVFGTAVLQFGLGVDSAAPVCAAALLICLLGYMTSKFIYLFLVEKAFIIRGSKTTRRKSKLYLFNSLGMIGVFVTVALLNFVFRFTRIDNGECIMGMERKSMIPLISFDILVNIYLTSLFVVPLAGLYSFTHFNRSPANLRLRKVAIKTFIGSVLTLLSSIVNLVFLMALNGEPGWICLMCCNSDILFTTLVIQWVTSRDTAGSSVSSAKSASTSEATGVHRASVAVAGPPPAGRGRAGSAAFDSSSIRPKAASSSSPPPSPSSPAPPRPAADPDGAPAAAVEPDELSRPELPTELRGRWGDDDNLESVGPSARAGA